MSTTRVHCVRAYAANTTRTCPYHESSCILREPIPQAIACQRESSSAEQLPSRKQVVHFYSAGLAALNADDFLPGYYFSIVIASRIGERAQDLQFAPLTIGKIYLLTL